MQGNQVTPSFALENLRKQHAGIMTAIVEAEQQIKLLHEQRLRCEGAMELAERLVGGEQTANSGEAS
jgi:hypothetical protein